MPNVFFHKGVSSDMENKFYPLFLPLFFGCLLTARAQDSTGSTQIICIDSIASSARTEASLITAYPNPVSGHSNVGLTMDNAETINISIYRSMGNLLKVVRVEGVRGQNHLSIPTVDLPSGIYYMQIQSGNETRQSKIQKL